MSQTRSHGAWPVLPEKTMGSERCGARRWCTVCEALDASLDIRVHPQLLVYTLVTGAEALCRPDDPQRCDQYEVFRTRSGAQTAE